MQPRVLLLVVPLLLPQTLLALDAETQRLEQEVLCQAMPYRTECGGTPPVPSTPAAPAPQTRQRQVAPAPAAQVPPQNGLTRGTPPAPRAAAPIPPPPPGLAPPETSSPRPTPAPTVPTQAPQTTLMREDLIRAASAICAAQLGLTEQSKSTSKEEIGMLYVCMRAYLAREGIQLPR